MFEEFQHRGITLCSSDQSYLLIQSSYWRFTLWSCHEFSDADNYCVLTWLKKVHSANGEEITFS